MQLINGRYWNNRPKNYFRSSPLSSRALQHMQPVTHSSLMTEQTHGHHQWTTNAWLFITVIMITWKLFKEFLSTLASTAHCNRLYLHCWNATHSRELHVIKSSTVQSTEVRYGLRIRQSVIKSIIIGVLIPTSWMSTMRIAHFQGYGRLTAKVKEGMTLSTGQQHCSGAVLRWQWNRHWTIRQQSQGKHSWRYNNCVIQLESMDELSRCTATKLLLRIVSSER